jgi:HD-like signal output (HDOD) protein
MTNFEPDNSSPADLSSEAFIDKLTNALRRDGDFPASAKVVSELRELVSKPETTANQVTELILREPSLGMRVLHVANSSFYRRAKPIMTVSQAVVQIGMRPLSELCSGLVLLQKFVPAARSGGVFADCLRRTLTTAILTSSINHELQQSKKSGNHETGFLAGTFFEMGTLLMAFYFPRMYEAAVKRAESKACELEVAIKEITGLSPAEISVAVLNSLHLPGAYGQLLTAAETGANLASDPSNKDFDANALTKPLFAAQTLSTAIINHGGSDQALDVALKKIRAHTNIPLSAVNSAVLNLQDRITEHCGSLELQLPPIPNSVRSFVAEASGAPLPELPEEIQAATAQAEAEKTTGFSHYVEEIRGAVNNREPTASVITSVMETLAFCMRFDRVVLLLATRGKASLNGRMALGNMGNINPQSINRSLGSDAGLSAPDAQAMAESRPMFQGEPLFEDGWPFAALPIGFGDHSIGVVYCDRIDPEAVELTRQEQASIGVLCELLDRSVTRRTA